MNILVRHGAALVTGAVLVAGSPAVTEIAVAAPVDGGGGTTTKASVADDGAQANGNSRAPAMSADGRYVAFTSAASNLAPGDTNHVRDVFVRDRRTATTELVSVPFDGVQTRSKSMSATISADGRFVAFVSDSSHLVPGDTNGESDVFVRDLQEGTTERVSVNDDGTQAVGNAGDPEISGDGRFVSFWSGSNLDPSVPDVPGGGEFVRDRVAGTTEWVTDDEVAAISDKGRFVAFVSTRQLSPDDTDDAYDVYVLDRRSGTTSLASTEGYLALEISMSDNGRFVAYDARATARAKVRQVYVRDMRGGTTTIASVNSRGVRGDGESFDPVLSRSGRYVAFGSFAHNLGRRTGPRALYYGHDLRTDVTRAISVNSSGAAANQRAWNMVEAPVAVSATGDIVAFVSHATNLVRHDTNERFDVFVRERR